MFVVDLIQRAVDRDCRFEFIDATVTAMRQGTMSSHKGAATSHSADDGFEFHFVPRTQLPQSWLEPDGHLFSEEAMFSVTGTERGSATWFGQAEFMRLVPTSMGPQVHGKVREWTRVDQKAVHSAFMRLIVPGRNLYPTKVRHVPGKDDRTATVKVNGWHIEFHDHGEYSEILLPRSAQLPVGLCGALVSALGRVGGHELNWVYREIHENRQRCITARALPKPAELRPGHDGNFDAFWRDYAGELQALVA